MIISHMTKSKHCIQVLTLREDNEKQTIKTVGFIFVEDKKQIVFNPSIKEYNQAHLTWHKDGTVHMKDNKGIILFSDKKTTLNKFKGQCQFLFFGQIKDADLNIDYKLCEDSGIFLIDLRQFQKGLGLSVHICDYHNVNKTMKVFSDKPHHQSFVYWKSNPKVVLIAFDN